MTKQELVEFMAEKAGLTKADATRALDAFVEGVTTGIDYETITKLCELFGCEVGTLLTFEKKEREERSARNPRTGETIKIPARSVVTVKVGSKLKEAVK